MAGDHQVDGRVEPLGDVQHRAADALAGPVGAGLDAALVQQHDDRLHPLGGELRGGGVGGGHLVGEAQPADAGLGHQLGRALQRHADEAHPHAAHRLDRRTGQHGLGAAGEVHVGGQPREVGAVVGPVGEVAAVVGVAAAVLHALQFGQALVELVVAHAGHVEAHRLERLDAGLVVEQARQERRPADQVPGRHRERVGVALAQRVERGGQVLGAANLGGRRIERGPQGGVGPARRLEVAVVVVERQHLHGHHAPRRIGVVAPAGVPVRVAAGATARRAGHAQRRRGEAHRQHCCGPGPTAAGAARERSVEGVGSAGGARGHGCSSGFGGRVAGGSAGPYRPVRWRIAR
ncbi:MAG: hypothetical protein R2749_25390 [Acidimicrobiales bacterium]